MTYRCCAAKADVGRCSETMRLAYLIRLLPLSERSSQRGDIWGRRWHRVSYAEFMPNSSDQR
ncbi:MAG: hypothetical protein C1943_00285 [Halochromatium sp.]|nr:hypothetical protein [Halochromatium sp.]